MADRNSFKIDTVSLHSAYNPEIQAERFITNEIHNRPACILIVGEGYGYISRSAEKHFPGSRIISILASPRLPTLESGEYCQPDNDLELSVYLTQKLNYRDLASFSILFWPPGCRLLQTICPDYMQIIHQVIENVQMELITLGSYGRKFIGNSIRNLTAIKEHQFELPDKQALVIAPGSSLDEHIEEIRRYSDNLFILSCSSSLHPVLSRGIIPDAIITSDAGFHAGGLFHSLTRRGHSSIPVFSTIQANLPSNLNNPVFFFGTAGSLENDLFSSCSDFISDISSTGTVTAAAVHLLRALGFRSILFAGLDLSTYHGKTHAANHSSTLYLLKTCSRIQPISSSIFHRSIQSSRAMAYYKGWFCAQSEKNNDIYVLSGSATCFPRKTVKEYSSIRPAGVRRMPVIRSKQLIDRNTREQIHNFLLTLDSEVEEFLDQWISTDTLPVYMHRATDALIYTALPALTQESNQSADTARQMWNASLDRFKDLINA
ncbi:6-hydroxymethylpterin diphosphokinase MptE-like protein [Spirochaeta dissipatitropha]